MYIEPNGDVMICCESDTYNEPAGNIHVNDLKTIQQSPQFAEARELMMADKWPRACHYCKVKEERFGASSRTGRLKTYRDLMERNADNFTTMRPERIFKLKMDFSNGCNLRCNMCSEHRSTSWIKDKQAMIRDFTYLFDNQHDYGHFETGMSAEHLKKITSNIPRSFVDDNIDFLLTLEHIEVSGGEPFYHPEFLYLLDKLIEAGWNKEMKIITNLTLLTPEICDKLKHFNTRLIMSLDACGDLYEYIRPSLPFGKYNWQHVNDNLEMAISSGFGINFAYTVQLLNFYNLEQWRDFYHTVAEKTRVPNMFNNNSLVNPPHLMICNHPDQTEKQRLADVLSKDDKVPTEIIKSILATPNPNAWNSFCKYIDFMDNLRGCHIFDYIPEFEQYWIKD